MDNLTRTSSLSALQISTLTEAERCHRWFWLFCAAHLFIWVFMPLWLCQNAPFDSLEGIAWGNQWQLGYDKHPFLAPWLTAGMNDVLHYPDLAIYLLSQLSVITCFWAMWRIAQSILLPRLALISVLLLEGIYYYNIASPQFNPNILMLATWALASLAFYRAVTCHHTQSWLIFGVTAGLTLLTKYEAPLLLGAMFVFLCVNPQARQSLKTYRPYAALLCALLVFLPNLWWLFTHHFAPFTYTADRLGEAHGSHNALIRHVFQPIRFLIEQVGAIALLFIMAVPLYFYRRDSLVISVFHKQFLWIVGLGPLVLALFVSAAGGFWLNSLWAYPFFSFVGILFIAYLQPIITPKVWKYFIILWLSLCALIIVSRGIYLRYSTYLTGHEIAAIYPGKLMTTTLTQAWNQDYHTPVAYVAGSATEVRNFAGYSKDKPEPYFTWNKHRSAWIDEARMHQQGAIFIWKIKHPNEGTSFPASIQKRFPQMIYQGTMTLPMMTSNKKAQPIVIAYAFLPPESYL